MLAALVVFTILLSGTVPTLAQTPQPGQAVEFDATAEAEKAKKKLEELLESGGPETGDIPVSGTKIEDPARPDAPPEFIEDSETRKKYLGALKEYYEYRAAGLQHRREVLKWQLFSAKVIFSIVLLVVATGIVFAGIQFSVDLRRISQGKEAEAPITELQASTEGIKVTSSVLGVIILALSLAFFYLYLVHVYPIEDIF